MGILYKYYGFTASLNAIEKNTLGFSDPTKFNDPMEGRFWLHQNGSSPNWLEPLLRCVGILCLTKEPLNPLMWSHYGQNHEGFVIGYDDSDPLFSDQRDTVINANSGEIFSTPQFVFADASQAGFNASQWIHTGMTEERSKEIEEAIRHIFLMKQDCWSYEQEIRVVKLLSCACFNQSDWVQETGNNPTPISEPVTPMISVAHPFGVSTLPASPSSIKRIILGMRNPLARGGAQIETNDALQKTIETHRPSIEIAKWDDQGKMLSVTAQGQIFWGSPVKISSLRLSPAKLQAISDKISGQPVSEQSLIVTEFNDGLVGAYWANEI